jgi:putative endonuclease
VTVARQSLGRSAEDLAAERLAARGCRILERNARINTPELIGEIDLIALDGAALVFVEVKAGRAGARAGPERPALAVGPRKRAQLRRLARAWMAQAADRPRYAEIRFDVIGIRVGAGGGVAAYEHIEAAF